MKRAARHPRGGWLALATLLACAGCGGSSTVERVAVRGAVTVDGAPLELGSILFVSEGAAGGPKSGGTIEAGRYEIDREHGPPPGPLRVEIRAPQLPPGAPLPDDESARLRLLAETEERLPARYHLATTLRVAATKDGPNEFDFSLDTRP